MIEALYTGIMGLQTNQYAMDVTSNNIANVNTIGFKSNGVEFKNIFAKSLAEASGPANSTVGLGSAISATPLKTSNGTISLTNNNTDLSINSNGWFGVTANKQISYTRNGAFSFDANKNLVTTNGQIVLGTLTNAFNANGLITNLNATASLGKISTQQPITLPTTLYYPVTPTTKAIFKGNLGINNIPQSISAKVINLKGNTDSLKLLFTKNAIQPITGTSWDVTATLNTIASTNNPSKVLDTKTGIITFDKTGALLSSTLQSINNSGTPLNIDLGKNFNGITSNASKTGNLASSTNGEMGGDLSNYSINQDGDVVATFTNAKQVPMAKIAVYHFQNEQGLKSLGGADYGVSNNSGKAFFYQDSTGKNILGTSILTGTLENSNVSLSTSLTQLIILQRSYDANAKSITVGDQLIKKALKM